MNIKYLIEKHLEKIYNFQKNNNELFFTSLFSRNNYYLDFYELFKKKKFNITWGKKNLKKIKFLSLSIKLFLYFLFRILITKIFVKKKTFPKIINLFKIFYNPNFKSGKDYNKIFHELNKNILIKKNFYYLPIVFNYKLKNILNIIKNLTKNEKFIYWEHHISVADIIKIFFFSKKILIPNIFYGKNNLKKFYEYNLLIPSSLESYYLSKIFFLFFYKVKKKTNIKKFISIWENQSIDKAIIKSIKNNFKNCESFGILVENIPKSYYAIYPTKIEFDNNFIPEALFSPGNFMKKEIKKKIKKIKIKKISFINYKKFFPKNIIKTNNILVVLPIYMDEIEFILNKLLMVYNSAKIKLTIKFHPTTDSSYFFLTHPQFNIFKNLLTNKQIIELVKINNKIILGTSSLYFNLICSNVTLGIMSSKFNNIKNIYGLNSMNSTCVNDIKSLKKFLLNHKKTNLINKSKFKKLYMDFNENRLKELCR
jgi:hypothetical protein